MNRTERRALKLFKARYGHSGIGSSHTREAAESEVRRHVHKMRSKQGGRSMEYKCETNRQGRDTGDAYAIRFTDDARFADV